MNRAERRRNAKQEKPKTYTLTDSQIKQMKTEATTAAFSMLLSVPVVVLHDKFCFDGVQLDNFIHYCLGWIDGIHSGELDLNEVLKICENEAGIKIVGNLQRR